MPEATLPRTLAMVSSGADALTIPGVPQVDSPAAALTPPRHASEWSAGRVAVAGVVLIYLVGILVLPLSALLIETAREGLGAAWEAITSTEAIVALVDRCCSPRSR